MAVKNSCTPASVFGGFTQTLFLGCSVSSFAVSAGWNEQVDELTVQIVQDLCSGNKIYYDDSLEQQSWTSPDPGFIGHSTNIIGCPVYFRVADFEFSGIVQSWEQVDQHALHAILPVKGIENGNGSIPNGNVCVYTVKIVDPRQLLENCQVIINEYSGGVGSMDNIINVFGFLENADPVCSTAGYDQGVDGRIFGTPYGGFGGAETDNNGISWNRAVQGARVLLSGISGSNFSNGFVSFRGASATASTPNGMGLIGQSSTTAGETHYIVDMAEVPSVPNDMRVNGVSFSLLNLISDVCQTAGYDYYVELLPVDGTGLPASVTSSGGITPFIKIRTINRNTQPTIGKIDDFIDSYGSGSKSNSVGLELRNDTTEQLVIGGFKQNIFDTDIVLAGTGGTIEDPENDGDPANEEADNMIVPYFGVNNTTGDVIVPTLNDDDYWEFDADTTELKYQLTGYRPDLWGTGGTHEVPATITIEERELQAALVSYDMYVLTAMFLNSDMHQIMDFKNLYDNNHLQKVIEYADAAAGNPVMARDMLQLGNGLLDIHIDAASNKRVNGYHAAYEWIRGFATEYYGKKYQVRVPYICSRIPTDSDFTSVWDGQVLHTDEPNDGGWSEVTTLLGLSNPSAPLDFFRHDDMRIQPILRFDGASASDVLKLSFDDYIGDISNDNLYVRANIEPYWVYTDKSNMAATDIRAVLTLNQALVEIEDNGDKFTFIEGLAKLIEWGNNLNNGQDHLTGIERRPAGQLANLPISPRAKMPDGAIVPTKSNVLTYGPWADSTLAGGAVVTHDEGLVPWEYGSYSNLNTAGTALAGAGITSMQYADYGSITVPGYPTVPLHAELLSSGSGGRYENGENLFENRSASSSTTGGLGTFYTINMGGTWTGTYGPNITGLSISVGAQGLETSYTMRTWTPKFGVLASLNAERIKRIGQNNMKMAKTLRGFTFQRGKAKNFQKFKANAEERRNPQGGNLPSNLQRTNSPHEYLVATMEPWNNYEYNRFIMASNDIRQIQNDFSAENWQGTAIMSWDGIFSPVSINGRGGLPRFGTTISGWTPPEGAPNGYPLPAISPIGKSGSSGTLTEYNIQINSSYLNPLSNPSGNVANRSDTPEVGHHIEIIGRGQAGDDTLPPGSSIVMPIEGAMQNSGDRSKSDYRSDYSFLAMRGPIVMASWGYDTNGFPIPNKVDIETQASGGVFEGRNLQQKFMDGFLRKPSTWPVGPIDLRWDRQRSCWVSPPAYSYFKARLTEPLMSGASAVANIIEHPSFVDSSGSGIASESSEVKVFDCVGQTVESGRTILIEFDSYNGKYNVIHAVGSGETVSSGSGSGCPCPTSGSGCATSIGGVDISGIETGTITTGDYLLYWSTSEMCVKLAPVELCPSGTGG